MEALSDFFRMDNLMAGAHQLTCDVTFNPAHAVFKGHFPDKPIVPGVCTMELVRKILERAMDKKIRLDHSANIKFLGLIDPEMKIEVLVKWRMLDSGISADATISNSEKILFRMNAAFDLV